MNETFHLSDLDKRILSVLQKDASLSAADLARATNSSPATCWRRLRALEENGVVGPPIRLVNPKAVDRGMDAFCQIRMKAQNTAARDSFQRAMEQEPAIIEIYSISGEWDYLLHLLVKDMADLEHILMSKVLDHDSVAGSSTLFAMRRVKKTTEIPV